MQIVRHYALSTANLHDDDRAETNNTVQSIMIESRQDGGQYKIAVYRPKFPLE